MTKYLRIFQESRIYNNRILIESDRIVIEGSRTVIKGHRIVIEINRIFTFFSVLVMFDYFR